MVVGYLVADVERVFFGDGIPVNAHHVFQHGITFRFGEELPLAISLGPSATCGGGCLVDVFIACGEE